MATFTDVNSFAQHVAGYGKRVEGASAKALKAEMEAIAIVVKQQGERYHIKGRGGKSWPLGAKTQGPYPYGGTVYGYVLADPAGFWMLVEKGSYKKPGGWDIYPRKIGKRAQRNAERRGQTLVQRKSLSVPGRGYFAKVHHPHIGAIGHPWRVAMVAAERVGPKVYEAEIVRSVFAKAA